MQCTGERWTTEQVRQRELEVRPRFSLSAESDAVLRPLTALLPAIGRQLPENLRCGFGLSLAGLVGGLDQAEPRIPAPLEDVERFLTSAAVSF